MTTLSDIYSGLMASVQEFGRYAEQDMPSEAYLGGLVDKIKTGNEQLDF